MVEHSPKILASEEKATTPTTQPLDGEGNPAVWQSPLILFTRCINYQRQYGFCGNMHGEVRQASVSLTATGSATSTNSKEKFRSERSACKEW